MPPRSLDGPDGATWEGLPPPPHTPLALPPPAPLPLPDPAARPPLLPQLARHVELAAGGAHRTDPATLCQLLQRLGYSAKLHESTSPLAKFKRGVRHQYITVCLPSEPTRRLHVPRCWSGCTHTCVSGVTRTSPPARVLNPASPASMPAPSPADTSTTGLSGYIVDPNFRDCFCIAHPTTRYAAVLDGVPAAVVADRVSTRPPVAGRVRATSRAAPQELLLSSGVSSAGCLLLLSHLGRRPLTAHCASPAPLYRSACLD